jgi:hypothetical protein
LGAGERRHRNSGGGQENKSSHHAKPWFDPAPNWPLNFMILVLSALTVDNCDESYKDFN